MLITLHVPIICGKCSKTYTNEISFDWNNVILLRGCSWDSTCPHCDHTDNPITLTIGDDHLLLSVIPNLEPKDIEWRPGYTTPE